MNICSRRNCSGKLGWSGDGEGKEHANSLLVMNTDTGPDKSWNYLLIPLSRVDSVFVIAHCCLCLLSLAERDRDICVKDWFMKQAWPTWSVYTGRFCNQESPIYFWKEVVFLAVPCVLPTRSHLYARLTFMVVFWHFWFVSTPPLKLCWYNVGFF